MNRWYWLFILKNEEVQAQRNNYKQLEIEMAFEPMTQFEQVSLFW